MLPFLMGCSHCFLRRPTVVLLHANNNVMAGLSVLIRVNHLGVNSAFDLSGVYVN